jgi:hypothetical protein
LSRHVSNLSEEEIDKFEKKAIKIFPTNILVANFHKDKLENWENPTVVINPQITPKTSKLLLPPLIIGEGVRVILKRNLWPERFLCSGSIGKVVAILYKRAHCPSRNFPSIIFCHFDGYKGPTTSEGTVPIPAESERAYDNIGKVSVRKFNIKVGEGLTAHSAQGLTLDLLQLYISEIPIFSSYFITSITRVEKFENLCITGNLRQLYFDHPQFFSGFSFFKERMRKFLQNNIDENNELSGTVSS